MVTTARPTLFVGGAILSCDVADSRHEALLVHDGRIASVGPGPELRAAAADADVVDLDGATLLPGINDAHAHLAFHGINQPPLAADLAVTRISGIVGAMADQARRHDDAWVRGFGFNRADLVDDRWPTRHDLDRAVGARPAIAHDFSGHAIVANTAALHRSGIDPDAPPASPNLERDDDGRATGVLHEDAQELVTRHLPDMTRSQRETALRSAVEALHREGITSVTDAALGPGGRGAAAGAWDDTTLSVLADANATGGLGVRVTVLLMLSSMGGATSDEVRHHLATWDAPEGDPAYFRVAGLKVFADGVPGARTAWLHDCYDDRSFGRLSMAGDDDATRERHLRDMIRAGHDAGLQVGVHATGDRTTDVVVDAFAVAQRNNPRPDPRHYVIHAPLISPAAIRRLGDLGGGVNVQPLLKTKTGRIMDSLLGPERARRQWPLASILAAGVPLTASSDLPITGPNWRLGVAAAMERRLPDGTVSGPEERLDMSQALAAYTRHGAWQDHAEGWKGTLTPGKVADLCLVDADLTRVEPNDLGATRVLATWVDGEVVHDLR